MNIYAGLLFYSYKLFRTRLIYQNVEAFFFHIIQILHCRDGVSSKSIKNLKPWSKVLELFCWFYSITLQSRFMASCCIRFTVGGCIQQYFTVKTTVKLQDNYGNFLQCMKQKSTEACYRFDIAEKTYFYRTPCYAIQFVPKLSAKMF